MAQLILITSELIAAGIDEISKAIASNSGVAAGDILLIVAENKDLQEGFDALKKEHEALAKVNAELKEQLEALPAPQNEKQKPALSDKTFTHEKQTYGFAYPQLKLDGSVITADDVVNSKDLQKKLVEMKSGFIKAV